MSTGRVLIGLLCAGVLTVSATPAAAGGAGRHVPAPPKRSEAAGYGGAVSSVDADATRAGIGVLRRGGSATDAAVAVAAALGVTEPYSAGVGGGGYFVRYDADTGGVSTIDGRETAPAAAHERMFTVDGRPMPRDEAITSGLSVGVPGTPMLWQEALDRWGSEDLSEVLRPAERLARNGFTVDETFREQTRENAERFRDFPATAELFMPGGEPPEVGTRMRNPDLAETYRMLARDGVGAFYDGPIGADVVDTVNDPPVRPGADRTVRPGGMSRQDLRDYRAAEREPARTTYRGREVHGMAPSSSGGTTVGEALNILERSDLSGMDRTSYLHRLSEATKIGFADRNRWVGDPAYSDVPTEELLGDRFAAARECLIDDGAALPTPVAPGDPRDPADCRGGTAPQRPDAEGPSTTHLTVADAEGNVVSYTLTIEQTGGSGITVPGRGFLLNNELTDFSFTPHAPGVPDPNLPEPGKRPRSSMSPTIVTEDGRPVAALGTPGGTTIITTVTQLLTEHLDRGRTLAEAIAAPRISQRNESETDAEPAFLARPEAAELRARGHRFAEADEIGAATGVRRLPDGRWVAAAEPTRRGGGSAEVVVPAPAP
ncbi:gamma-glutamyltransferase [Salinifilum ghardaiensis]